MGLIKTLQTHHMYSTLKRSGNEGFHVVSTWNIRAVFVGNVIAINTFLISFPGAVVRMCSVKKGVLRNFAKFTRKHLCQRLFFNKVAGNFIKKESLAQVFSCEFCEISKNRFFTEHLGTAASGFL